MQKFELLRYHIYILEDSKDCTEVLLTVPNRINVFAFDTETNTKINMAKRDENLINIKHDKLFLLQFGFDDNVYVCDVREKSEACIQAFIDLYDACISRAVLAVAHNIKFDINMLMNAGYTFHTDNLCDTKTIARLALESKSER